MRYHLPRRMPAWAWVLVVALALTCAWPVWAVGGPTDPSAPSVPLPTVGAAKEIRRAPLPDGSVSLAAPSQSTAAETLTLEAVADTTVLEGFPTRNLGSVADMWVGYDESLEPQPQTARSLVRFDLTLLPEEALIANAALRLYLINSWDYPNRVRTATTYRIAGEWVETAVTWATAPASVDAYGSAEVRHAEWRWYSFDVTELVRAWHAGTYANQGIMLRGPEVSGDDSSRRGFSTREGPYAPQLVIEYGVPHPVFLPLLIKLSPAPVPTATPTASATPTSTVMLPSPSATPTATEVSANLVYITDSGTRYHREGCRYLTASATAVSCTWAEANGYTPCSVCQPTCP